MPEVKVVAGITTAIGLTGIMPEVKVGLNWGPGGGGVGGDRQ